MNNILTLETNKYAIKLDNFEGPLDLLCHLVDKNKMDINQIKISEITDQYIDYINKMQELNLDVTSEFILMASTLLFIKSKSLLPKQVEDEAELTEEEQVILKRGRNAKPYTKAKHATMAEYKKATALEALMGYLYLTGQEERVLLLIQKGMDILETQKMN